MKHKNISIGMSYSVGTSANINLGNLGKYDWLAQAITANQYDVVEFLINHDPNVGRLKFDGKHVLSWITESTDIEIIKLLASKTKIIGKKGWSPLMISEVLRHIEAVQILIDRGADVNWNDGGSEFNPLEKACIRGYEDSARLLLANGAVATNLHKTGKRMLARVCKYNKTILAMNRILTGYNNISQFVMLGRK